MWKLLNGSINLSFASTNVHMSAWNRRRIMIWTLDHATNRLELWVRHIVVQALLLIHPYVRCGEWEVRKCWVLRVLTQSGSRLEFYFNKIFVCAHVCSGSTIKKLANIKKISERGKNVNKKNFVPRYLYYLECAIPHFVEKNSKTQDTSAIFEGCTNFRNESFQGAANLAGWEQYAQNHRDAMSLFEKGFLIWIHTVYLGNCWCLIASQ